MPKKTSKKPNKTDKKVQIEPLQGLKDYGSIFSARLTSVVQSQGWSQEEFGRRLGVSQVMAGRYLHGKANPTFENLARMEAATQVPVAKFFENDEPIPKPISTNITEEVRMAVGNATAENTALLKTIANSLNPAISALNDSNEKLPINIQTVSRGKLRDFVDRFVDDSMTGYVYELIGKKASDESIKIELVRELAVNLLADGGDTAKELRSVLTDLLDKEEKLKRG